MTYGIVINPIDNTNHDVDVDVNDFWSIQKAIGGYMYEQHAVVLDGRAVGMIYMVENRMALPSQESFAFDELVIEGHQKLRIYGPALFVPMGKAVDKIRLRWQRFTADKAEAMEDPVIRSFTDDELEEYISSGETARKNATIITATDMNDFARKWAKEVGGDPNQTFMKRVGVDQAFTPVRPSRPYNPRPVGTFNSNRCEVAELEAAFLGLVEWMRKSRDDTIPGHAFTAPTFFFPEGLSIGSDQTMWNALKASDAGELTLPFPYPAFWIVAWETFLGGANFAAEGPMLVYVEGSHEGFTAQTAFRERSGYTVNEPERFDHVGMVPGAVGVALYKLNRSHRQERVHTPELAAVNAGRAKSKRHLAPLPGFIRVTGIVGGSHEGTGTGREVERHDRRGHWRKRRNGVELPPEAWVWVRDCTIHPEKPEPAPKPYLVQ